MAQTVLHEFAMDNGWTELERKLAEYETTELFQELDDTIQFDILGATSDDWALMRSKKIVYTAICRELMKRCRE